MTSSKSLQLILGSLVALNISCSTDSHKGKLVLPGTQSEYANLNANFWVDTVAATSSIRSKTDSTGQISAKTFNFSACLVDPGGNPVIGGVPFEVSDGLGGAIQKTTDRKGCIYWDETYELRILENEIYYRFKRTIAAKASYKGEVYVDLALNPWQDGQGALLDTRKAKIPANMQVDNGPWPLNGRKDQAFGAKVGDGTSDVGINVPAIKFIDMGFEYGKFSINQFLGLTMARKYQVRFQPSLIRSSFATESELKVLNKGRMRVLMTILKDLDGPGATDPRNVITSLTFEGKIIYGTLFSEIVVPFSDIASRLSRSKIVVTVEPLDELSNVQSASFIGVVAPGTLGDVALNPTDLNARNLADQAAVRKAQQRQSRSETSAIQMLISKSNLKAMKLDGEMSLRKGILSWSKKRSTLSAVEDYLNGRLTSQEMISFESQLMNKANCLIEADIVNTTLCQLDRRDLIDSMVGVDGAAAESTAPEFLGDVTTENLTLTTQVVFATNTTVGSKYSISGGASASGEMGLGWKIPAEASPANGGLGVSLKVAVGAEVFASTTNSDSSIMSVASTTTKTLTTLGQSFAFTANIRPCLLLTRDGATGGEYYCSSQTRKEKRIETYYLVNEKVGDDSTGFTDSASPTASPWRMLLRGPKVFNMFGNTVKSLGHSGVLTLEKLPANSDLYKALQQFPEFYMMQEFPGMLTP